MNFSNAQNIFAALANESRLKVFRLLAVSGVDGLAAGEISKKLKITANTLSFHLLLMTQAGLLKKKRKGVSIFYSADLDTVKDTIEFIMNDCCQCDCDCHAIVHHLKHK